MATRTSRLGGYRERRDTYFKDHENSPLTPDQKEIFSGLSYFPENGDLHFTLEFDQLGEGVGEIVTFATVSGSEKQYIRAGRVSFAVDGRDATLSVFRNATSGKFFVPFRDSTSGKETYEIGRYLDVTATPDSKLVVDFNLAYNPLCAYSSGWSCSIPPVENALDVPIQAGEILPEFVDHSDH